MITLFFKYLTILMLCIALIMILAENENWYKVGIAGLASLILWAMTL